MALIEEDLFLHLTSKSDVTDLIGTKIYPTHKPQSVDLPYAVYHIITDVSKQCLGGGIWENDIRVQIDIYAADYPSVANITEVVKDSLIGFKSSNNISVVSGYDNETEYFKKILDFKLKK